MQDYLFSYGTLQPNLAPAEIAPLVRTFHCVGRAYVRGVLYDFGNYPGVILSESGKQVWGQLFALPEDAELLHRLDKYEGFEPDDPGHSLFVRIKCATVLESGSSIESWIYVYNRDPGSAPAVAGGDYSKSRAGNE